MQILQDLTIHKNNVYILKRGYDWNLILFFNASTNQYYYCRPQHNKDNVFIHYNYVVSVIIYACTCISIQEKTVVPWIQTIRYKQQAD